MATCSIEGCEKIARTRGLCSTHYQKWLASTNQITCSVDGCDEIARRRGWCFKHYQRWKKYGDPLVVLLTIPEAGTPQEFIKMALNHQDKEKCLFWPYSKNSYGYAYFHHASIKRSHLVSRYICEQLFGPPPTSKHEAAHNCGKGHLGCINPHHLEWKTHADNMTDKIIHETDSSGEGNGNARLTWDKVREIRAMQGTGLYQREIAYKFGVTQTAISLIWRGKMWKEN